MSTVVAVAGGSGNLGRTIVEAILADGKFTPIILARKASCALALPSVENPAKAKLIGAPILAIDYTNVESLTKSLEEGNIAVVISVLNTMASIEPELNLIAASDASKPTKRFIPSIWGVKFPPEIIELFPSAKGKLDVIDALASTSLEYTVWIPGYFSDWYIAPHLKTYMSTFTIVVDVANNTAAIPGSADVPVALTYTFDMAKLVAASLTLPKWELETYCIGDKVTWNELIAIAEEVKGTKFKVTYDSVEKLRTLSVTELPDHPQTYSFFPKEMLQAFLATFGVMFDNGTFNLTPAHDIQQDFPDIKLHSVKELLTEA
ncbi:NmrA domain-containing protein [Fusarium falciforme]|uniref:NmrA domain-containing protein n=1 Tax=Fusarium falciforme TaxID=195108 RepID=UPI002300D0E8|nr:NmrA domain-containing protein [Fusarium falciforme]WAO95340.1 NmrA domain-containing protein [Fusarium falciforme]